MLFLCHWCNCWVIFGFGVPSKCLSFMLFFCWFIGWLQTQECCEHIGFSTWISRCTSWLLTQECCEHIRFSVWIFRFTFGLQILECCEHIGFSTSIFRCTSWPLTLECCEHIRFSTWIFRFTSCFQILGWVFNLDSQIYILAPDLGVL